MILLHHVDRVWKSVFWKLLSQDELGVVRCVIWADRLIQG